MAADPYDPLWLSPKDAVSACARLFSLDEGEARGRLVLLAEQEIIRTWCTHFHFRNFDEWATNTGDSWSDNEIPASFWERLRNHALLRDWTNGTFGAAGYQSETYVHGVRFSLADLHLYKRSIDLPPLGSRIAAADLKVASRKAQEAKRALSPKLPRRPKPFKTRKGGPVAASEFDAWHGALSASEQALGYRDLWALAIRAFRPRKVVRKLAEDLVRDLKRGVGRKSKSGIAPSGH